MFNNFLLLSHVFPHIVHRTLGKVIYERCCEGNREESHIYYPLLSLRPAVSEMSVRCFFKACAGMWKTYHPQCELQRSRTKARRTLIGQLISDHDLLRTDRFSTVFHGSHKQNKTKCDKTNLPLCRVAAALDLRSHWLHRKVNSQHFAWQKFLSGILRQCAILPKFEVLCRKTICWGYIAPPKNDMFIIQWSLTTTVSCSTQKVAKLSFLS